MSKRGFLMFANNNEELDYGLVALINALMIKANCKVVNTTALVTDEHTLAWMKQSRGEALVARAFDHIIVKPLDERSGDVLKRNFHDTLSTTKSLPWRNKTRRSAYDITPFEETMLIDADYLVCDGRSFDLAWGLGHDVMVNRHALTLEHKKPSLGDQFIEPFGVPLYWATAFYFRKSDYSKMLFDLIGHISEHYQFFQLAYRFRGNLFRNDFVFSIAIHILNGFTGREGLPTLPESQIVTSFDCDELYAVPGKNELTFFVNDTSNTWRFTLSRFKNTNIHVMNKFSITRHAERFLELYGAA